jgi:hypothetical protein
MLEVVGCFVGSFVVSFVVSQLVTWQAMLEVGMIRRALSHFGESWRLAEKPRGPGLRFALHWDTPFSPPEHPTEVFPASPKMSRSARSGVEPWWQLSATLVGSSPVSMTAPVRGSVLRHLSTLGELYERVVQRCCPEVMPGFEIDSETTR